MVVIPARMMSMDGTIIEQEGMEAIRANRAINVESGLPPMDKDRELKSGAIAIVGYGPSLLQTWERLREFQKHGAPIWTVSKAHDFLVERGIVPTYHLDLDMRVHKAEFMKNPQKGTRYFLSTHIHPSYIEKMKAAGMDVQLFHVAIDPNERLDPRYSAMSKNFKRAGKVRFDAGIQAAEAAFQRGYREQHWFGIEYGRAGEQTHAGLHWGTTSANCVVDVDGRQFGSTKMFFHGLLLAEHFLCDRALVKCTIHGDGLLGHFLNCRGRAKFTLSA